MRYIASILAVFSGLILAGLLTACPGTPSPDRNGQPSNPQPEKAPKSQVDQQTQQSSGSQESIPADETAHDPGGAVLNLLARLGYDKSTFVIAQSRLVSGAAGSFWTVEVEQGGSEFGYGIVQDGTLDVTLVKLAQPSDVSSPAALRPGPDLPERVAEALGLPAQGYVPVTWLPDMFPSEYRKYAPYLEYQVCTHRVIMATDVGSGGLRALMFEKGDTGSISEIRVDRETAIDRASGNGAGGKTDATHVDLVFIRDQSGPEPSPALCWEICLSDGTVKYVNCRDGSVMPYQLGM